MEVGENSLNFSSNNYKLGLKGTKFKEYQEMLGVIVASLIEEKEGICPTDEEFALYIEGRLNKEKKKAIVSHFVSCRECREKLTIPIRPFVIAKEGNPTEKFPAFLWRPLVAVPVAVIVIVLLAFSLNVYLNSRHVIEERVRGGNLVAVKQVDLTPSLLTTINKGDKEGLKNELIKDLPSGVKVSDLVVEDIKNLKGAKEGDRIILILYSNGLLKVKLEK
jgi:hypothetical protein